MQNISIFSIIIMLALSSFDKGDAVGVTNSPDTSIAPLGAHKWYLKKIYRDDSFTQVLTKKAFISFKPGNGSAGGNGSCNAFGTTVTIAGNNIGFKNIVSTKMYCDEVQSIENDFFQSLQRATRYETEGKKMFLFEKDELLLEFEKEEL